MQKEENRQERKLNRVNTIMRAYEFKKPIDEAKIVEIVPAIGNAVGRVGQAMGGAAAQGAGAAAAMGKDTNKAQQVGDKVAKGAATAIQKGQDKVASAILKKGSQLAVPTQGGKEEEFDIVNVDGDEVTLKNPNPKTGEPQGFIYKKDELDAIVKAKADKVAGSDDNAGGNPAGQVV